MFVRYDSKLGRGAGADCPGATGDHRERYDRKLGFVKPPCPHGAVWHTRKLQGQHHRRINKQISNGWTEGPPT